MDDRGLGATAAYRRDVTRSLLADLDPADRPRERLIRLGPDALSDAELIALLLGSGRRGRGAVDLAQDLLDTHGGLPGLARALPDDLLGTLGIGSAKATRVVAALALARRFGTSTDRRDTVRTPADVVRIAGPLLPTGDDRLALVIGDRACRLVDALVLPVAAHRRPPPVRAVLGEVLRRGGVVVALAHRHDAGAGAGVGTRAGAGARVLAGSEAVAEAGVGTEARAAPIAPHPADLALGRALAAAGGLCGVRVLEHVVLDGDRWGCVVDPPVRASTGRARVSGEGGRMTA